MNGERRRSDHRERRRALPEEGGYASEERHSIIDSRQTERRRPA
jgi:hypothetical protein